MMSQMEDGYRQSVLLVMCLYVSVAVGPWISLLLVQSLTSGLTGPWGAWPNWAGGGWLCLCLGALAYVIARGWLKRDG